MVKVGNSGEGDSGRPRKESSLWVAPSRIGKKTKTPSAPAMELSPDYENTRQNSFLYDGMYD